MVLGMAGRRFGKARERLRKVGERLRVEVMGRD